MGWLPRGTVVKNLPVNAEDARDGGPIPGWGRSPNVGNGNPLQYSCLEHSMDRGAWWATVHEVAECNTTEWLSTGSGNGWHNSVNILKTTELYTLNGEF